MVGKAYSSRESGKDIFEVERMGVYLRDTYDFNAGKFEEVFMGLGVWSRDRLLRLDEMTEFKLNVLAGIPGRIANHLRYPGFVPVRNIDFRHWQEKHNSGGDFFVLYFPMCYGRNPMLNISRSKSISRLLALKWWLVTGVILFSIWYYIFGAQSIVYTLGVEKDGRCYSPNHEYYIIRTQSRWEYFYHSYPGEEGMVSLYDKN